MVLGGAVVTVVVGRIDDVSLPICEADIIDAGVNVMLLPSMDPVRWSNGMGVVVVPACSDEDSCDRNVNGV